MKRALALLAAAAAIAAAAVLYLTRPARVDADRFAGLAGDAAAGERIFWAAGCASCHAAPDSDAPRVLAGGQRFKTPFGTFTAPNISTDPEHGIGAWEIGDFASALLNGTSPGGSHYYPAFPYASYARMRDRDVADLWAFLRTLPADPTPSAGHELSFPFNVRAGLGLWKALYLSRDWVAEAATPEIETGRYLVEALGHCGECHTPRDAFGGPDLSAWLTGAPNPAGDGRIPGVAPGQLTWSAADIAYYLESGFTPDFDSAGGEMVEVIENTARLAAEERQAIAAYLKALPRAE